MRMMHTLGDRLPLQLIKPRPDRFYLGPEQLRDDEVDDFILPRRLLTRQMTRQILQVGHGQGGQNVFQEDVHGRARAGRKAEIVEAPPGVGNRGRLPVFRAMR